MSLRSRRLGAAGESLAAKFLQEQGYRILHRNYRWARGELDIVAEHGQLLVFVEVKTARSGRMGAPESWVTPEKQRQIGRVARRYLQEFAIEDRDCRFDVIAITMTADDYHLEHIENAFWLTE